jgi:hypothetical protein
MAISDLVTRALIRFEGDTTDLKAKIKDLQGEEKRLAEVRLQGVQDGNKAVDSLIDKLSAQEIATKALNLAVTSLKSSFEQSRLESAASGVSIDRLREATKGLKLNTELLSDAARLNNGAYKLNTEQMVIAEQAMVQFNRRGMDSAKVHEAILQAVTALKVDGLKDLGVFVDVAGLSMDNESHRGEILKRVFEELTKASRDFGNQSLSDAEKIQIAANKLENTVDKLKNKIGKGLGYGIMGVERMAEGFMQQALSGFDVEAHGRSIDPNVQTIAQMRGEFIARMGALQRHAGDKFYMQQMGYTPENPTIEMKEEDMRRKPMSDADIQKMSEAFLDAFRKTVVMQMGGGDLNRELGFVKPGSTSLGAMTPGGIDILGADVTRTLHKTIDDRQTKNWKDELGYQGKERTSVFEKTFGDLGKFNVYKAAWDGLTQSVVAGYDAMVDGSMKWQQATKMAAGAALKALGASLQVEALKEVAAGFASIALGPIGGASAAAHFQAAALYEAGSIAAGVASHALGGGVAPKSPATSAGLGSAPGAGHTNAPSGFGEPRGRDVIHIIGDPFDMESDPRKRQNNVREITKRLDRNHYAADY